MKKLVIVAAALSLGLALPVFAEELKELAPNADGKCMHKDMEVMVKDGKVVDKEGKDVADVTLAADAKVDDKCKAPAAAEGEKPAAEGEKKEGK